MLCFACYFACYYVPHILCIEPAKKTSKEGKKPDQEVMGMKRRYYLAIFLSLMIGRMALTASAAFARNGGIDSPPRANGKGTTGSDGAAIFKG
ncbi:MAG: hypothetical protein NTV25_03490 [Methanothrix sp.]|nr:hypothetical protein [Methanothrix sp.]